RLFFVAGALLVALAAAIFLFVRSSRGEERLVKILRRQLEKRMSGPVEIGSLGGELPSHIILHDVVLHDADGKEAVRAAELRLRGDWHARVLAHGPLTKLSLDAEVTPPRGKLQARAQLASHTWWFELNGDGLDPAAAFAGAPALSVAVAARGKGEGGRGSIEV